MGYIIRIKKAHPMRLVLMSKGVDIQSKVKYRNLQKLQVMTLHEALIVLTRHQQWQKDNTLYFCPKELTEAIDIILAYHHVDPNKMI